MLLRTVLILLLVLAASLFVRVDGAAWDAVRQIIANDNQPGLDIKQHGATGVGLEIYDEHGVAINITKGDIRMPNNAPLRMKDAAGIDQGVLMMSGNGLRMNSPSGIVYLQRDATGSLPTGVYVGGGQQTNPESSLFVDAPATSPSKLLANSNPIYQCARVYENGKDEAYCYTQQVEVNASAIIVHRWLLKLAQPYDIQLADFGDLVYLR